MDASNEVFVLQNKFYDPRVINVIFTKKISKHTTTNFFFPSQWLSTPNRQGPALLIRDVLVLVNRLSLVLRAVLLVPEVSLIVISFFNWMLF